MLGEKIKELRMKKGITQEKMGEIFGLDNLDILCFFEDYSIIIFLI